ncbi:MAG: ABC transporter substrate-binding protein, partial [Casimicrobiaceae bacterium]
MKWTTLLLALLAALLASAANAQDKVTLRLNWLLYGFHTPFYLGVERGYYKDEKIDLTIGEGQGSVRAVQTVGAKSDMFGLADGGSIVAGVAKGAPVKAVLAVTNSSPYSLAVRADAGIKTLKDLEGKTVASAPGEAGLQLLPALFARNGVDIEKVKILRVDGAGKMVAVAEKRAEGLMAGLDNQSLTLP